MKTTISNSSMISAIEWENEVLTITWKSGKTNDYQGVPESEYHAFVNAESVGKHYHGVFKQKYA